MLVEALEADGLNEQIVRTIKQWGITDFTEVQVAALKAGLAHGRSQVVCAPTSSGKTLVGEIAILSALFRGQRGLYLVSHKALADQKYADFESRLGDSSPFPIGSVGLSTGDRDEGDASPHLLVATYEKALALVLSGQLDTGSTVVVADELQILGEASRGPNIETLCSIIKKSGVAQFVALTATVGNAGDIADWLECELVATTSRDVDLHQEVWYQGAAYRVPFGQDEGERCRSGENLPNDALDVVRKLVGEGLAPVLVFTETRNEASNLATRYSNSLARTVDGIAIAEQLQLFSEPTEASQQLQDSALKKVAFHNADLTAQERQVVEAAFAESKFTACFATSTLAAGVNFPFRSVVFPKLTYEYGEREGTMVARSDYRNMSGRAGRKGLHDDGWAILLPKNARELAHANSIVLSENDNVESQLVRLSMRKTVLALASFRVVNARADLVPFFHNTLYWHQIQERNPRKLDNVVVSANTSLDWLIQNKLIEEDGEFLLPTPVGRAIAQSGLLPSTAVKLLELLRTHAHEIDANFDSLVPGLVHWVCVSDEFLGETPSRYLPWPAGRAPVQSTAYLRARPLLAPLDRTQDRVNQCAHAVILFATGLAERHIRRETNIPSGQVHRLAADVAWVLDGLRKVASVPELDYPQTLTNKLSMLSRQVHWGAPPDALDILRVAQRERVPGFGRQRALALLQHGIETFDAVLGTAKERLSELVGGEIRAKALLTAIAASLGIGGKRFDRLHRQAAEKLGVAPLFDACAKELGVAYEVAIKNILEVEKSWTVRVLDDGKEQNVPDLLVTLGGMAVLVECKTTTKKPPLIKKEEAFAVVQKAADFDKAMHRVTLGKPAFDEHSKEKAGASTIVSLVEHDVFMEGMLRVIANVVDPMDFLKWLAAPGVTEVDRLGGRSTFEIASHG